MPSALPAHLPILDARLASEPAPSHYVERELTEPMSLCTSRGLLRPEAVGWSRAPLVRANLSRHWPRKKRWNFWNFVSPRFCLSTTLADIDFAAFAAFFFVDFSSGERVDGMDVRRSGHTTIPEEVERTIAWSSPKTHLSVVNEGRDLSVSLRGAAGGRTGTEVRADFIVRKPADHESLNVVVPWSDSRFQLNSKHNTLRCEGHVEVGGRRYELRPDDTHAVQDWGRGIWPHRSFWNWGVATGEVDGELVGVNVGDRWTTGTGSNENGILHRGRLTKVMEDLEWSYEPGDWRRTWRVRTRASDRLDLSFEPFYVHTHGFDAGFLATGGTVAFGRWHGVARTDEAEIELPGLVGWTEEIAHRW